MPLLPLSDRAAAVHTLRSNGHLITTMVRTRLSMAMERTGTYHDESPVGMFGRVDPYAPGDVGAFLRAILLSSIRNSASVHVLYAASTRLTVATCNRGNSYSTHDFSELVNTVSLQMIR